jgi:hypothetical protein
MNFGTTLIVCFSLIFLTGIVAAAEAVTCYEQPSSPDGTCCFSRFNLQEENRMQLAAPTVVDYSESNGNLLIRGPMPLIIRDGKGNDPAISRCKNQSDWQFAYDELGTMIGNQKTFAPVYFTDSKEAALKSDLQDFNLDNYHVIVVSLLDHGDINPTYFASEQKAFGGNYSSCSDPLKEGNIHGQSGNLIWSTVGFCDGGIDEKCKTILNTDTDTTCSYANLIEKLSTMMAEKDPSGKKRLIYFHCVLGTDRTGGVTIGYLQKTNPSMSFTDAVTYATHLGKESGMPPWPPNAASQNLANAYCQKTGGLCNTGENTRVYLPGRDTHSHLPGQEDAPSVTPVPTPRPVLVQTPVPAVRYNPAKSDEVNF